MNKNIKLLLIVLGVVAAVLLAKKFLGQKEESFASGPAEVASEPAKEEVEASGSNADYKSLDNNDGLVGDAAPADCFPKDQLTAQELLPTDANNQWAQVNPDGQGELGDQNFLSAGFHIGVNTVGQSLRNANLQLRSEPANPQVKVSPWQQSTIEPDNNRKPLEIGCEQ